MSNLVEIQKMSINKIKAELKGLNDAQINGLEALENEEDDIRSGVMTAIARERVIRKEAAMEDAKKTETPATVGTLEGNANGTTSDDQDETSNEKADEGENKEEESNAAEAGTDSEASAENEALASAADDDMLFSSDEAIEYATLVRRGFQPKRAEKIIAEARDK